VHSQGHRVSTLLVATHYDECLAQQTAQDDGACLARLIKELQQLYPAAGLYYEPLLVNTTDLSGCRAAVSKRMDELVATAVIGHGDRVPRYLGTCFESMRKMSADAASPNWLSVSQYLDSPGFAHLSAEQRLSVLAVMVDMGAIVVISDEMVVLKPQWLLQAICASLALTSSSKSALASNRRHTAADRVCEVVARAGANNRAASASTPTLSVLTDPANPGYLTESSLKRQLAEMAAFSRLADNSATEAEAGRLIGCLIALGYVLPAAPQVGTTHDPFRLLPHPCSLVFLRTCYVQEKSSNYTQLVVPALLVCYHVP